MSLFQSIVIEKYVRELDSAKLETAWQTYSHRFLNLSKQDNIRLSKEEQYQEGFLRDLFVDVFGYTLNPNPNYNITTEFKNQTGSKKVDGAIIKDGHAIGVIELKGMNTTDLSKIEQQAFGYKNNQPKCRYVITSNFHKLRLYIDNAVEFIEFNLFTLTQADFALLYLLLNRDSIMSDLPATLKSASLSQEEAITKQLYKDYSVFKRELFNDLITNNPSVDNLVLFQKSQKLLDRLLFIFFAEDSHLLPANFAKGIISEWEQLKSLKMTVPLYDRVKAYFGYLDKGHKDEHSEIFAYNGGLFSTDELLDSVIISDDILQTHIKILSEYDFDSEVDVNILGHIFENSLTELDEVKAQLEGTVVDKSQTKRKKDGVFYTPKYITKYIVENTVGKLCTDKKLELGINEENYYQEAVINKDGTKKKKTAKQIATEKVAFDSLNAYRDWLLQITICDPAVGSGAFLNEALNFLIAEHDYIVELETKLFGSGLAYPDIENSILENNLFGVDINEESVEIAKLSLWLRTAQPRRKLNNLNDNIQCGNSLIDDPAVAGDKAFNWQAAFPQVFAKGGFDVVIGNPPYGVNFDEKTKSFLSQFDTLVPDFEIYIYFISLYTKILKKDAYLSYIFPNTFLSTVFGKKYRRQLLNHINLLEIVDLSNEKVFSDASVRTIIFSMKNNSDNYSSQFKKAIGGEIKLLETYSKKIVLENHENMANLFNQTSSEVVVIDKIKQGQPLDSFFEVSQGLIPYDKYRGHDENTIKNRIWHSTFKKDETFKKELKGADVNAYSVSWNGALWVSYGKWLAAPREPKFFTQERILIREITNQRLKCGYTELEYYNTPSLINLINEKGTINLKYALCILNSNLIGWYHNKTSPKANKGLFPKILVNDVRNVPLLAHRAEDQQPYIKKADLMLALSKDLQDINSKFTRSLQRNFDGLDKLSKKLQSWHDLTYAEFIKELGKKKIKMGLSDEAEWEEYFLAEQTKAKQLIAGIERTDREIDQMVYKLYDLTDDEIAIIEAS